VITTITFSYFSSEYFLILLQKVIDHYSKTSMNHKNKIAEWQQNTNKKIKVNIFLSFNL